MKQFFSTILAAFVLIAASTSLDAQKKFEKGSITYEVTDVKSQEPMVGMMKGSTFGFSFDDDKIRFDMDMMGGMMAMKMVTNGPGKAPVMLMDMMGQKIQLDISEEDMQQPDMADAFNPENIDLSDVKVDYVDGTKEIAGYKCRTANVTAEGQTFQVFTTNKIGFDNPAAKKVLDHFGGFPLGMSINAEGTEITVMAKTVENKVSGDVFKLSTEGYQKMTPEEFGKQMGGGFGF